MYPTSSPSWQEIVGHCKRLTVKDRLEARGREYDQCATHVRKQFISHEDTLAADMQRYIDQACSKGR